MNKTTAFMVRFYGYGRTAEIGERFQVIGAEHPIFFPKTAPETGMVEQIAWANGATSIRGSWNVHGEIGDSWTEMVEVASYFNNEGDGCFYYVGNTATQTILLPTWDEIKFICNFRRRFPDLGLSFEERLALHLSIGGWLS